MAIAEHPSAADSVTLKKDPRLKRLLQELRQVDNWTNFLYIARVYAILIATIGGAIWFYHTGESLGLSWWWNVPVTALAVLVVGASQHQLAGAAHEATHHTLFRNRWLNELVSDWLCMYPLFSSTHQFRLHHLAHHQFINDPVRDPDFGQLKMSGHWLDFPVPKARFALFLLKQLWLPNLVRYIWARLRYDSVGDHETPYTISTSDPPRLGFVMAAGYVVSFFLLAAVPVEGFSWLKHVIGPLALLTAAVATCLRLPERYFLRARLAPVVPPRLSAILRLTYLAVLFTALSWTTLLTGVWAGGYFLLLWVLPIFTAFAFFMILRQLVQHGNGDRGWLTNTRVFLVNPLLRYAVFPFGMDYHLPHHMFATVPHYRLPRLHRELQRYPEYAQQGIVVENYVIPRHRPPRNPTCLEVIGPEYHRATGDVFVDSTVLENWRIDERDEIERHQQASLNGRRGAAQAAAPSSTGPDRPPAKN